MKTTAPNKEINVQALGAAVAAVLLGAVQWLAPSIAAPPPGFEAGFAVVAGLAIAHLRKIMQRRKMTEIEREIDTTLCAGRVHILGDSGDHGFEEPANPGPLN